MNRQGLLAILLPTFIVALVNLVDINTRLQQMQDAQKVNEHHHTSDQPQQQQQEQIISSSSPNNKMNNPALLQFNSSHYTWTGNHFIPPKGVPTFAPIDFHNYFRKRNTLFIGDSTARRTYGTLFALMNMTQTEMSDIQVSTLDDADVLDFNKSPKHKQDICKHPEKRNLMGSQFFTCRTIVNHITSTSPSSGSDASNSTTTTDKDAASTNKMKNTTSMTTSSTSNDTLGKFDFYAYKVCYRDITLFFEEYLSGKEENNYFKDYDLIILAAGIWDAIKTYECRVEVNVTQVDEVSGNTTTVLGRKNVTEIVKSMMDLVTKSSSPDLQIAIRTPGFHQSRKGESNVWQAAQTIIDSSNIPEETAMETKNHNITVVDWGTVISKRSFGDLRIAGDIQAHYGLEARLLASQQLLHELLAAELRQ